MPAFVVWTNDQRNYVPSTPTIRVQILIYCTKRPKINQKEAVIGPSKMMITSQTGKLNMDDHVKNDKLLCKNYFVSDVNFLNFTDCQPNITWTMKTYVRLFFIFQFVIFEHS